MDQPAAKNGKPGRAGARPAAGRTRAATPDAAFDLWLQRGLHQMFDEVAREPIPPEILALIEADRQKS